MKSLAAFLFSGFLLALPAAAQHGGSHGGGGTRQEADILPEGPGFHGSGW